MILEKRKTTNELYTVITVYDSEMNNSGFYDEVESVRIGFDTDETEEALIERLTDKWGPFDEIEGVYEYE